MRRALIMICAAAALTCGDGNTGRRETGLETLGITSVDPGLAVPGTTLVVEGQAFLDEPIGISWLRLVGQIGGSLVEVELPADFVDFEHLDVPLTPEVIAQFGAAEGTFTGQAMVVVDFTADGNRFTSGPITVQLDLKDTLEPVLDSVQDSGGIFVNDPIELSGSGFLLGGAEGSTYAVIEGCFIPVGSDTCEDIGQTEVVVVPDDRFDRNNATFAFSPRVAGISPGRFEGRVFLRNRHAGGDEEDSGVAAVVYDVIDTQITGVGPGGSFGQYIDIDGGGFIGKVPRDPSEEDEGLTLMRINGEYFADGAVEGAPVADLDLIPEFVSGRKLRYVIDEEDLLGQALEAIGGVRYASGDFDGSVQTILSFGGEQVVGPSTPLTFRIEPVRQVVHVQFNPSYVESLRIFGLRSMDQQIRERILEVLRRDYATINVEFRTEEPDDYKIFAVIDIAGPDPNGLGLLGYDNTPGKDTNNERLFDRIGGVNALTQEDGFPGFGGVFLESVFAFSNHPPTGGAGEVGNETFDEIFDPFRPDRGGDPVSSSDLASGEIPPLTSAEGCPSGKRRLQVACAVWTLGSVVGSTVSHELGHSLGLADPVGTRFHNLGDGENRLMDKGGSRGFEERGELKGRGPSMYCEQAYEYLRDILPTGEPPTDFPRPGC